MQAFTKQLIEDLTDRIMEDRPMAIKRADIIQALNMLTEQIIEEVTENTRNTYTI